MIAGRNRTSEPVDTARLHQQPKDPHMRKSQGKRGPCAQGMLTASHHSSHTTPLVTYHTASFEALSSYRESELVFTHLRWAPESDCVWCQTGPDICPFSWLQSMAHVQNCGLRYERRFDKVASSESDADRDSDPTALVGTSPKPRQNIGWDVSPSRTVHHMHD